MSSEIATLERVRAAVQDLHGEGAKATADAVISRIGGGSKPTVLKHLRVLREIKPLSILEKAKPFLAEIFVAGSAAHETRTREQTERYHRMMSDLEAQVAEFEATIDRLERDRSDLSERLKASERALGETASKLEQRDAEIAKLQAALADSQREQARHVTDRLASFEARIADLAGKLEPPPAKPTGEKG
jgi:septal ring factor EnvC (AmiA/AmiB activator)